ncbi:Protein terminal ear1 like [Glycine soja]|nr:Protein terminal ear1 like [Glycine soja]
MVSLLNPEAPEYLPSHNHKLQQQQQQLQPLACPTSLFPHHGHFSVFSLFPSRHPNPFFYYPTLTLPPPPSIPLALEAHQQTRFHNIKNDSDSNPVEAHAVHQKKDQVVLAEPKTGGGSIGLVKKQALNAYINGRRSAESWRQKSYPPRKKVEENGQRKNVDFLRNRKVFRQPDDEQPFRGFPKRNRFNLSLPVRDGETTVMIRNIPSKYTTRMNKGYAFVNFTQPQAARKFLKTASNLKWELFQSNKIRDVVSARLQGKEQLEEHFATMNFPYESEDVLPVSFSPPCDGVNKGEQRTIGNLTKRQHV